MGSKKLHGFETHIEAQSCKASYVVAGKCWPVQTFRTLALVPSGSSLVVLMMDLDGAGKGSGDLPKTF